MPTMSKGTGTPTIKQNLDRFRTLAKLTNAELYGTDENFHEENDRDLSDIRSTIRGITASYKKNTGEDIIEFFNAVNFNAENKSLKQQQKIERSRNQIRDIQQKLENPDLFSVSEIFSQETGRFQLYNSYNLIYENIPQMTQALSTYVDNILSPDDFTKTVFSVVVDGVPINGADMVKLETNKEIIDNCKKLIKNYNLENRCQKYITNSLKLGDQFVAVLNYNDELSKIMLNEDETPIIEDPNKYMLKESEIEITDEEVQQFSALITEHEVIKPESIPTKSDYIKAHKTEITDMTKLTESYSVLREEYEKKNSEYTSYKKSLQAEICEILNKNVLFTEDTSVLLESNKKYDHEYQGVDIDDSMNFNNSSEIQKGNFTDKKKNVKAEELHLSGSIIKELKAERTVKLVLDEKCYGYYYIDNLEDSVDYLTTGAYSINSNIFTNFRNNQSNEAPDKLNVKYRLITDIFVRNFSKKIDKKFVNNHPEFKDIIYNLLRNNYILDKQIRIIYLPPNKVIHFGIGEDTYKDSIFKPILFQAKLYLAVLTSQVMLRLVRSPEKRAFYIETDLDNDTEAVVQSFIRDTKTKDIKMSNFGNDINTIMNSVGTFQDYFIPVVDGQKPVEIDTIPGMNIEVTNDFLEYLLKGMISGMGIPPEFLSYSEQTEFARSLGMMNGKFVRAIIVKQKVYAEQFSQLVRLLYKNEYLNAHSDDAKEKKAKEFFLNKAKGNLSVTDEHERAQLSKLETEYKNILFDLNLIEVKFPSPQSLNMTALAEQINNSQAVIDFIVNTLCDDDNTELKEATKKAITQDILSTFDWEKYEKIYEKSKVELVNDAIEKTAKTKSANDEIVDDPYGSGY